MQRRHSKNVIGGLILLAPFALTGLVACSDDSDEGNGACDDTTVVSEDEDADFASYKTFAVADQDSLAGLGGAGGTSGSGKDVPDDVELSIDAANDAAAAQLKTKGLEEVDPSEETPDLWLFSAAATQDETGTVWQCVPGYDWWGYYWVWDPCAWVAPIPVDYTAGTLIVGVADAEAKKVVFGGVAEGILECTSESELEDRVTAAVDDIFAQYPND